MSKMAKNSAFARTVVFPGSLFIAVLGALALAGCGSGGPSANNTGNSGTGGTGGSGAPPAIVASVSPKSTQGIDDGQTLNVTATLTNDSSGKGVTWAITGVGTLTNETTTGATYNAPASGGGTATITATSVADTTKTASTTITVTADPAITTTSLPAGTEGTAYSQAIGETGGALPLTFSVSSGSLPPGLALSAGGIITGTPTGPNATSNFTVKVTDASAGGAQSAAKALSIVINLPPAPVITTSSLPAGVEGVTYNQTVQATSGAKPYTFTISSGSLPAGLTMSSAGVISGKPLGPPSPPGFTVQVTDSENPTPQTATQALTIGISQPAPPTITTTSLPGGTVGTNYNQTVAGTCPSSATLGACGWAIVSGAVPAGLSFNTSTGAITGKPTGPASGTAVSFTVTYNDKANPVQTATQALNITISDPAPPTITTTSLPGATEGVNYSHTLAGTCPSSASLGACTWGINSGAVPAGLSLNTSTGAITGKPTGPASATPVSFTVSYTDKSNPAQTATQALSITVSNPAPPTITTTSLPGGIVGINYLQNLAGTCPSSATLGACTWAITSGAVPAGLTFNAGLGRISGTPTGPASTTPVSFTITYADQANPQQSASQALSITISNPPPPIISPSSLPNGTQGTSYSQVLTASSGLPPYSGGAVTSGGLPGGLTLTETGTNGNTLTISGIPNNQAATGCTAGPPEVCNFTISVNDSSNPVQTASKAYTVTFAAPQPLTITGPASLPNGAINTAYGPVNVIASGGIQPYTFSLDISSNPLPAGMNLSSNGAIGGTPTASGSFPGIVVDVTDSEASPVTVTKTYSLTITVPALTLSPSNNSSLPNGTQGTAYTATITASGGIAPYTFSLDGSSAALPSWATFTANSPTASQATITGTPNATGTTNGIIVDVRDSEGTPVTVKATYSLSINATDPCSGLTDAGNESILSGSYVFLLKGFDNGTTGTEPGPEPVLIGGVLTFNGTDNNGLITAGTLDMNLNASVGVSSHAITSGSYIMDASDSSHQRACMTITTSLGTQHYRVSLANLSGGVASTGHMIGFDTAGPFTAGTLRKQSGTSLANGNYAFGVSAGQNSASCNNSVCGGDFGAAGVFKLSGGSVTGGEVDFNNNGQLDGNSSNTTWPATAGSIASGGTYSFGGTGRGTLTFTPGGSPNPVHAVLYAVSTTDALILASDDQTNNSLFGGEMIKQSGTFTDAAMSGTFIIHLSSLNGGTPGTSSATIGTATLNGSGSFTAGTLWQNSGGSISSQSLSGITYSLDSSGDGRMLLGGSGPHSPVFWLIGANHAFLLGASGSVESGMVEPQSVTSAPSGTFAFGSIDPQDSTVGDNIGVATFITGTPGSVSGTSDNNSNGSQNADQTFSSLSVSVDSTGLGSIGSSGCTIGATGSTGCQLIFYTISANRAALLNLLDGSGSAQTNSALQIADK